MKEYKVVFHLDEDTAGRLNKALNNIRILLIDLGEENVDIEVVANGTAVNALRKSNEGQGHKLATLAKKGVTFAVCGNSMKHLEIQQSDLMEYATVVDSGIGELVKKQAQGWAYIRP